MSYSRAKATRHTLSSSGRRFRRRLQAPESLESRQMLDAGGFLTTSDRYVTLSFADDGTEIAGMQSDLFSKFDQAFARDAWQETILRAFYGWSSLVGTDIGIVEETDKLPFGSAGASLNEDRFGDIRIGSRPLAATAMAISVSQDSSVAGTWAADVVFNSEANFNSLDELYSVALHEAGHVFGLEHSTDSASPMYYHGASAAIVPTDADIQNIRAIHGARIADSFEAKDGNNTLDLATHLEPIQSVEGVIGSGPAVALANLFPANDVDFYRVESIDNDRGPVTFRLYSAGISLVTPQLTIFDAKENVIAESGGTLLGGDITVTLPQTEVDTKYYVRVKSDSSRPFSTGEYSLAVTFDDAIRIDEETLTEFVRTRIRQPDRDTVETLLSADDAYLNDDRGTNEGTDDATNLERLNEFEDATRFRVLASIATPDDVDTYRFATPDEAGLWANVSVRSLDSGGLVPQISLLDDDKQALSPPVLVNGGGYLLVQASVTPDQEYFVQVRGPDGRLFETGDYELTISFTRRPAEVRQYVDSEITDLQDVRTFYVATPQLVHFGITLEEHSPASHVLMRVLDSSGKVVHQVAGESGSTRTAGSILLLPGSYVSQVIAIGGMNGDDPIRYQLTGVAISDLFAVDPVEPSDAEFVCPDNPDLFCYPGGIVSEDPFIWTEFIDSLPEIPSLTGAELQSLLLGDWWSWYWHTENQNAPPLTAVDNYHIQQGQILEVLASDGVLSNDLDPDSPDVTALLVSMPQHGNLQFNEDGSFTYQPDGEFSGIDSFSYQAFDFISSSAASVVTIQIDSTHSILGDFDRNGTVNDLDINLIAAAIRSDGGSEYDLNADGVLDSLDWQFMINRVLGTTFGDANLDGVFNSADFVTVFLAGQYEDGISDNSTWSTGDWNGDGEFDSGDFVLAFQAGGYEVAAAIQFVQQLGSGDSGSGTSKSRRMRQEVI